MIAVAASDRGGGCVAGGAVSPSNRTNSVQLAAPFTVRDRALVSFDITHRSLSPNNDERSLTHPLHEPITHFMTTKIGRRHSLKVVGFGILGAAGLVNLAACTKEESGEKKAPAAKPAEAAGGAKEAPPKQAEAAGGEGCDATLDAASTQMRTALQYKEASDQEGKNCANCAQFKPGAYGDCGGCILFTGPVQNNGYCLSWAAKAG